MGKEEGWVCYGRDIVVVLALFNDEDGQRWIGFGKTSSNYASGSTS
jgi:hypothetical protein